MALRRSLLDRIGYFDEALGSGGTFKRGEEADFAIRTAAAGQMILSDPGPMVVHEGGVRPTAEAPSVWYYDGFAAGALGAKAFKCRRWTELAIILAPIVVDGPTYVLKSLVTWHRPFTLKRTAYQLIGAFCGVIAGLAWQVQHGPQGCLFTPRVPSPPR
jgi:hypothetical protein